MTATSLLTDEALSRAAFLLMSSSGQSRYRRIARQIAEEESLTSRLSGDPTRASEALSRISKLWNELISLPQSDVQEFELAVLLTALADADVTGIGEVLEEVVKSERLSTVWIEGLARHLLAELRDRHLAKLAQGVVEWMTHMHGQAPSFEPDALTRARLEAA